MPILDSILSRKSQPVIDGDIPQEDLQLILQCALTAPDHKSLRPWKYIIVRPENKALLNELIFTSSVKLKLRDAEANGSIFTDEEKENVRRKIEQKTNSAPYFIIATLDINEDIPINEIELVLSAGAATQNMIIAAEAMGYSCFWRTGEWAYNPFMLEALKLPPSTKITGFIGIGKMVNQKMAIASRRPAFENHFSYLV